KIFDPRVRRWEIPSSILPDAGCPLDAPAASAVDYEFSFTRLPFGFAITRKSDGEVIFNTTAPCLESVGGDRRARAPRSAVLFQGLQYSNQHLQISTQLPEVPTVYGLGERVDHFQLQYGYTYTLWNRDAPTPRKQNLYGSHPFFLEMRAKPHH